MITLMLALTVLQLVIQLVAYEQTKKVLFKASEFLAEKCKTKYAVQFLSYGLIILNIGISVLVGAFTGVGMLAGITNLFASCILGAYMYFEQKEKVSKLYAVYGA